MKIALVGYMGSGKSYWAKKLATDLSVWYVDLDQFIETNYIKMSISAFINIAGELKFRQVERQALVEIAQEQKEMVLATGGGTPCYFNNMEVLNNNFTTVYLDSSIAFLYDRLVQEKSSRPLIAHLEDAALKEFIAKHLFERRTFYNQAKISANANGLTLDVLKNVISHG
jgi:shikimate kinase